MSKYCFVCGNLVESVLSKPELMLDSPIINKCNTCGTEWNKSQNIDEIQYLIDKYNELLVVVQAQQVEINILKTELGL